MRAVEPQVTTETKLKRIAWLSSKDSSKEFTALMHYFNEESLEACFNETEGRKAVGIDGIDKQTYGGQLKENLQDLITRMKRMAYRPGPVREVQIPKDGKPKATRPLGISNFEDKLVQKMTKKVLESIYEPTFLNCSFGFRPAGSCAAIFGWGLRPPWIECWWGRRRESAGEAAFCFPAGRRPAFG